MNTKDQNAWLDKNERLNADLDLVLGMKVKDLSGQEGIVVEIHIPDNLSISEHGTVTVWQSNRNGYGLDNCEHYTYINWKRMLRVEDGEIHLRNQKILKHPEADSLITKLSTPKMR